MKKYFLHFLLVFGLLFSLTNPSLAIIDPNDDEDDNTPPPAPIISQTQTLNLPMYEGSFKNNRWAFDANDETLVTFHMPTNDDEPRLTIYYRNPNIVDGKIWLKAHEIDLPEISEPDGPNRDVSVSINDDGDRIAVGIPFRNSNKGMVLVYRKTNENLNETSWKFIDTHTGKFSSKGTGNTVHSTEMGVLTTSYLQEHWWQKTYDNDDHQKEMNFLRYDNTEDEDWSKSYGVVRSSPNCINSDYNQFGQNSAASPNGQWWAIYDSGPNCYVMGKVHMYNIDDEMLEGDDGEHEEISSAGALMNGPDKDYKSVYAMDMSNDTLALARRHPSEIEVYSLVNDEWKYQHSFVPIEKASSIAIHENFMVVGSKDYNNGKGGVFVYKKNNLNTWDLTAKIEHSHYTPGYGWGWEVDITDSFILTRSLKGEDISATRRAYYPDQLL